MITVTTKFLQVGNIVHICGEPHKVVSKQKGWKAPEYLITFEVGDKTITTSYYSNKKWTVGA
jgi:hypothetical protein